MSAEPYLGTMTPFAGTFTIEKFAMCLGQQVAISQNPSLFSILGATYGGDARTTFGIPDMRGRSPVGVGTRPGGKTYYQGHMMGNEYAVLALSQMPEHTHAATFAPSGNISVSSSLQAATDTATTTTPASNTHLAAGASSMYVAPGFQPPTLTEIEGLTVELQGSTGGNVTVGNTGGGNAIDITNPVQVVNWQISLDGLYPPRA
ncbi:phage tail protein [Agarivorans sp. QJM3NY_33]|uniref:phage tail protein n=1 Tax=Agarivorans sp. QJM3NY_33 TaxID=3421432 RepID=UPI003D7D409C